VLIADRARGASDARVSIDGSPARTGEEFLDFLRALATSDPANLAGSPLEAFLGSHPAALRFVQTPTPPPASFAQETFYEVTAMKFHRRSPQQPVRAVQDHPGGRKPLP
jgi:hypothetical protein